MWWFAPAKAGQGPQARMASKARLVQTAAGPVVTKEAHRVRLAVGPEVRVSAEHKVRLGTQAPRMNQPVAGRAEPAAAE